MSCNDADKPRHIFFCAEFKICQKYRGWEREGKMMFNDADVPCCIFPGVRSGKVGLRGKWLLWSSCKVFLVFFYHSSLPGEGLSGGCTQPFQTHLWALVLSKSRVHFGAKNF